jgi:BON domain
MFGSSGSSSTAFGGTGTSSSTGTANGLVGMSAGGMYGGTGYGNVNRGTSGSNNSSGSQYGSRAGQGGQYGGQGRQAGGSRRGGTGQNQGQPGQGGTAGNKDQQAWYEPRIDIGFAVTGPAPTVVQTNIAGPFHSPALTSRFGTVKVSVQGGAVILRGTVNSEEDRQLAAQMTMLEPSVSSVQNDLRVAAPSANPPR